MAQTKRITASIPTQPADTPGRSQSALDWNVPKTPRTPSSEYAFMRNFELLVCAPRPRGNFGPMNGGIGVAQ